MLLSLKNNCDMEHFRSFLESSTIHGLSYISTTGKYVRLFWILVVLSGFAGAGIIIYQSFEAWDESPVKTTIETRPISEITFPVVTVCPPKNTFTDLNHDLMILQNMTLDNSTRRELLSIMPQNSCMINCMRTLWQTLVFWKTMTDITIGIMGTHR